MANKGNLEREEILEKVEGFLMMGVRMPTEVMRQEKRIGDFQTAKRYIEISKRRLRNRYKNIERNKILKRELRDLDFMEKKLWFVFSSAANSNEKTGVINSIIKIKERRARLLGLDTENINPGLSKTLEDLIREDDEKNEQTINRGASLDTKQARRKSKVSPKSHSTKIRKKKDK